MPKKTKELIRMLLKAGFAGRSGKGSHQIFTHISGKIVVVPNHAGEAKRYIERQVLEAIEEINGKDKK